MWRLPGFTITELLVTIIISTLIIGVLSAVFVASLRVWNRCNSQTQAFPPAYDALERINRDMRSAAYLVTPDQWVAGTNYATNAIVQDTGAMYQCKTGHLAQATNRPGTTGGAAIWQPTIWIVMYPPKLDDTGATPTALRYNKIPLEVDLNKVKQYYLSDSSGKSGRKGSYLWRRVFKQNADRSITTLENQALAQNVQQFAMECDAIPSGYNANQILSVYAMSLTIVGQSGDQSNTSRFATRTYFRNPALTVPPAKPIIP